MKTIILILNLVCMAGMAGAQTGNIPAQSNSGFMVYSDEEEAYVIEDTSLQALPSELFIKDLPPLANALTPVKIKFTKGHYVFKADPSTVMPDDRRIYLEDLLTGQEFDLKSGATYSFNVTRMIPDRFTINIGKQEAKFASGLPHHR